MAFVYDDLYWLISAAGTYSFNPSKTRSYANLGYDSIHNILSKSQSDVITPPSGTPSHASARILGVYPAKGMPDCHLTELHIESYKGMLLGRAPS